jgi:putative ABC transport system permease protein
MTQVNTVTDGFFRTLEIPLLEGRDFDTRDQPASPPVVIVNRELARREWPNESPLGKRLMFLGPDVYATVVGVVGDVKQFTIGEPPEPQVDAPMPQATGIFNSVVARTTGDPMQLEKALRAAIWSVDPDQPVWKIRSLESLMARDTSGARFTVLLTGSFAVLALLLAAVGVYGVMSYVVAQRAREVGIRMALGGRRRQVVGMVLGRGLRLVGIATVLGVAAAIGASRLLRSMLFGVSATDLVTFVGVPLVLAAVAFVACWIPARRAARVDPMVALRLE